MILKRNFLLLFSFLYIISNSQDIFFFDYSSNLVATKDPRKTINLNVNSDLEQEILLLKKDILDIRMPFFNDKYLDLRLRKYKIYSDYLVVTSSTNKLIKEIEIYPEIISYKIFYKEESVGVLHFLDGEILSNLRINGVQYEISRFDNRYILFDVSNSINTSSFTCAVDELVESNSPSIINNVSLSTPMCLEIALEVDNYTRNTFNSNLSTINWALAVMTGASQIYESEINIAFDIVHINIWNSIDPYNSYTNQASNMLAELRNYWNSNNSSISRDIVHLITKRTNTGTGGIAYLDVLCNNNWGYGFSSQLDNDTSYNFPNPSYTWNLKVISHEIGHNFGSHHTHWCNWLADPSLLFPGGTIDDCYTAEGGCSNNPSPQAGTIMSYCHIGGGSVILDFHDIVVNQALLPGLAASSCLSTCDFYGCTDSTAFNYDSTATVDDGSCVPFVYGCIDSAALNYNPLANTDDSSCSYCAIVTFAFNNISCFGYNDGSIDLHVTGGSPPFTYSWTSTSGFSSNTQDLNNLPPSLYTVIVTDANSCTEMYSINIYEPSPITLSGVTTNDVSCFGLTDGSAIISLIGGTPPYNENWGIYNPSALQAGSYFVLVTDSNNCPAVTTNIVINQPLPITINSNVNNITCNGYNDGSIDITIYGGVLPYNYNWTSTNGFFSINEDINGLQSGTYLLEVTDGNSCISTFSFSIIEPPPLLLYSNVTNVSCYGAMDGSIDLTITGGNTPYNYIWSNGSTNQDLINIPSSNYWVDILDSNLCAISTQYFTVSQPPPAVVNSTQTNVSCNGFSDGTIDISFVASGTGNINYSWIGPNSFNAQTEDIVNLASGLYTLVIDNSPCSITETFYITEPSSLSILENIQHVNCFGDSTGQVNLTISGGTPPYLQNWFGMNPVALSAGLFLYEIIDSNGCLSSNNVAISQPNQSISTTFNVNNVTCYGGNDGSAQIFITGGVAPYSIVWQNANPNQLQSGTYIFTVLDDNQCYYIDSLIVLQPQEISVSELILDVSCNGLSDGQVNLNITGGVPPYFIDWGNYNNLALSAGSYLYQIIDSNSCLYSSLVNVSEPSSFSVIPTIINSSCSYTNDGSVSLSISGGTPPYNEDWQLWNPNQLSSGSYFCVITDNNQCIDTQTILINSISNISVQETINDISCFGFCDGNVNLYISGGIAPYSSNWNPFSSDSLCEGVFYYQITDSLSCMYSDSVLIHEPSEIDLMISQQSNQLSSSVIGGNPPYNYQWWNSSGNLGNTSTIFISSPGEYNCIVFDNNQCHSDTVSYLVTQVNLIERDLLNFEVFPNPFLDNLFIIFRNLHLREVSIFDVLGNIVYRKSVKTKEMMIYTKDLPSAVYLMRIITEDGTFHYRKIVKH